MKKLIKLIISLFVCGLMLLSGCGTPMPSLPNELKAPNTDYPDTVNILAPYFFSTSYADVEAKQQWLDEMSQRYGVKFNIISNDYTDSENTDYSASSKLDDVKRGNTTYKGLFSIMVFDSDTYAIKKCIEYDSVVPLEDYLADNPVWNALPDGFKSLFEVNGHIYAIPTYVSRFQGTRIIHNEALQKTGITVTDLDSFRDFAVAYAQKTGKATISCVNVMEMTDILNAFGLYPGDKNYNPFAYDPTEDCYADWLTKSAAINALEYLRELYKAGAIYLSYSPEQFDTKFTGGLIASSYQGFYNADNCTEVLTLNPEYPIIARYNFKSGFAMAKDTPQPKETINLLVNMLFGSEENYLDCWLGSSDNYTLNSDGTITIEMVQDSEGNYIIPDKPNLVGLLPDIFSYSNANIFYSQDGIVDMESKTATGKANERLKLLSDSLKNGSFVEIPLKYQVVRSATYEANSRDVTKLYIQCFQNAIISPDQTVQQVVDEYREAMLNLGGNFMLDEMNAAIGKKTAYYYG